MDIGPAITRFDLMKLPTASYGVSTRFINLRLVIFGFAENDFE
jgi:hypothetical protein